MIRQLAAGVLAGITACASTGCLVMSGSEREESGVQVSCATLEQIEVGRTTGAWIVATLGEPSSRQVVTESPKVEVLRYQHSVRESSGGTVFLIFAGGSEHEETSTAYFELTDGVVTKYWTES